MAGCLVADLQLLVEGCKEIFPVFQLLKGSSLSTLGKSKKKTNLTMRLYLLKIIIDFRQLLETYFKFE
jgi:hypothetical protein